jgi:hypothetical protein
MTPLYTVIVSGKLLQPSQFSEISALASPLLFTSLLSARRYIKSFSRWVSEPKLHRRVTPKNIVAKLKSYSGEPGICLATYFGVSSFIGDTYFAIYKHNLK